MIHFIINLGSYSYLPKTSKTFQKIWAKATPFHSYLRGFWKNTKLSIIHPSFSKPIFLFHFSSPPLILDFFFGRGGGILYFRISTKIEINFSRHCPFLFGWVGWKEQTRPYSLELGSQFGSEPWAWLGSYFSWDEAKAPFQKAENSSHLALKLRRFGAEVTPQNGSVHYSYLFTRPLYS